MCVYTRHLCVIITCHLWVVIINKWDWSFICVPWCMHCVCHDSWIRVLWLCNICARTCAYARRESFMRVSISKCVYICTYIANVCMCIHICTHTHMYLCLSMHVNAYICKYTYGYVCMYVCVYMCVYVYTYICIYIHLYIHAYV